MEFVNSEVLLGEVHSQKKEGLGSLANNPSKNFASERPDYLKRLLITEVNAVQCLITKLIGCIDFAVH